MKTNTVDYSIYYKIWHKDTEIERKSFVRGFHSIFDRYIGTPNEEDSVLDVGCGTGNFMDYLEEKGYKNVFGFDADKSQCLTAKKYHKNVVRTKYITKAISAFKTKRFSLISCLDVLEHIEKNMTIEICRDVYKHLEDNGKFILTVPNANSIVNGRFRYCDFTHETSFTETSIYYVLKNAGFGDIAVYSAEPEQNFPITLNLNIIFRHLCKKIVRRITRYAYFLEIGPEANKISFAPNLLIVAKK